MTRKYGIYSPEFKTQAVSLVKEGKRPVTEVARDLEINVNTLYTWLGSSQQSSGKTPDSLELKRLKKELSQVKLERDILKKAAAYFAKESL